MLDDNLFIEQAEYIDQDSLLEWSIEHPNEELILQKLSQPGAKLITGPRGCGKTTLLLKTYKRLCDASSKKTWALPIYVNYKSSLKLEPLYKNNANAVFWFNQWFLFKIYQGLFRVLKDIQVVPPSDLIFTKEYAESVISDLELARGVSEGEENLLIIPSLETEIIKVLKLFDKSRCVLLLDDAPHAFSPEQQRDFFDFFRQIRSKVISPKAAIYPGVTIYSPTFHVGHDAEEIDVWIKPDSPGYCEFMYDLLKRRLPGRTYDHLTDDDDLLQLLFYAAFGMPRSLLNMIRMFYGQETKLSFNKKNGLSAIKSSIDHTMNIYTSLKVKLPIYGKFITKGEELFDKMTDSVKKYNKGKKVERQSVIIGIRHPLPAELSKVLGFFQYGGMLLPRGKISKGEAGVFELYMIHYAALIARNALFGKKAFTIKELVEALKIRHSHDYIRITPSSLISTEDYSDVFPLSLPPCHVCNTPRLSEQAKFCSECGTLLKSISVFESVVNQTIDVLPLTKNKIKAIKEKSRIRTIRDILMDHENELIKVRSIGPHWAKKIFSYAEEYIT